MIHNNSKLIKSDKSLSSIYTQRFQINMKNWHTQQLDMTNFWVAAWLDDREVLCSFPFYLIAFMYVHETLLIVLNETKQTNMSYVYLRPSSNLFMKLVQ